MSLHAAAASSWAGLEVLVEKIGSSSGGPADSLAALEEAVARWRRSGLLEVSRWTSSPRKPETRATYGTDVGDLAPLYLGRAADAPRLGKDKTDQLLDALSEDGAALAKRVVPEDTLRRLRKRFEILGGGSTGKLGCPVEVSSASVLKAAAPEDAAKPLEPSSGRRHFLLRGTQLAQDDLVPLMTPLMPLVYEYFARHRPDSLPGRVVDSQADVSAPGLFLSECQLAVTDPGSVPQIWHRDNRQPGLAFAIPLTEVDDEVGPTHWLPGSHHFVGRGLQGIRAALAALHRSGGAVTSSPLVAGDVAIWDARLLHRGCANVSYGRCRVVLVLRIDCRDTPPPGSSIKQTMVSRWLGNGLLALSRVYSVLPGPA
eukprot:TRINITY_DN32012_c0_g1_i1.p1 TRINITY_DN32012_c0_g1~~TRINITY_DN32012_c0_g1_i1.p1  ORF type:complete len:406 (+),score=36.18 TRINITY_DN32012_c0_g1_i1:108-1220(+)